MPVPSHGDGLHDLVLKPARLLFARSTAPDTDCCSHLEPDPNAATIEDSHHYAKIGIDGAPLHAAVIYITKADEGRTVKNFCASWYSQFSSCTCETSPRLTRSIVGIHDIAWPRGGSVGTQSRNITEAQLSVQFPCGGSLPSAQRKVQIPCGQALGDPGLMASDERYLSSDILAATRCHTWG